MNQRLGSGNEKGRSKRLALNNYIAEAIVERQRNAKSREKLLIRKKRKKPDSWS